MDLDYILSGFRHVYEGHKVEVGLLAGLAIGYFLKALHGSVAQNESAAHSSQVAQEDDEDSSEAITPRSIDGAMSTDDESAIKGVVEEFYITQNGFSGMINDGKSRSPFMIDYQAIQFSQEEGIVPILLLDSNKRQAPLEMFVKYDPDLQMFCVGGIKHVLDGKEYNVGSDDMDDISVD